MAASYAAMAFGVRSSRASALPVESDAHQRREELPGTGGEFGMLFMRSARRPYVFTILVLVWNAILLGGFTAEFSLVSGSAWLPSGLAIAAFLAGHAVDALLVVAAGAFLVNGRLSLRLVGYLLFLVQFLAGTLQLFTHYLTGEYLSRLAVENVRHVSLLLSPRRLAGAAVALTAALSVPLLTEAARSVARRRATGTLSLAALSLAVLCAFAPGAFPEDAQRLRDRLYEANNVTDRSPLVSLIKVLVGGPAREQDVFTAADAAAAKRFGFVISPASRYPLLKDRIYEGTPPFAKTPGAPERPNIIVFFTEGLSARLTGPYGSPFPGITPNLDRFAANPRTMVITNYVNHTFATYRGLHGQLCSLFPNEGAAGWLESPENGNRNYFSLADYLRGLGYETTFLDTHRRGAARVDRMAKRIGFENVRTAEDLSRRYLRGVEPLRTDALSDHQLLEALVGFLAERQNRPASSPPFFVALYNVETHAFQDSAADGLKYGNGGNETLDTVHSFDHAFGLFLEFFGGSPLAKDTVVVFTSDHCHYTEKSYTEVMRHYFPGLPRVPVDAIPLIIYSPSQELPDTFDADFRTSLGFTPSLIHLLGFPQVPNPFLGHSIFSARESHADEPGIALIGTDLFLIDRSGIARRGHLGLHARDFWKVQRIVRYLAGLEENNRIWPGPG
jgi:hypothetical protein